VRFANKRQAAGLLECYGGIDSVFGASANGWSRSQRVSRHVRAPFLFFSSDSQLRIEALNFSGYSTSTHQSTLHSYISVIMYS